MALRHPPGTFTAQDKMPVLTGSQAVPAAMLGRSVPRLLATRDSPHQGRGLSTSECTCKAHRGFPHSAQFQNSVLDNAILKSNISSYVYRKSLFPELPHRPLGE